MCGFTDIKKLQPNIIAVVCTHATSIKTTTVAAKYQSRCESGVDSDMSVRKREEERKRQREREIEQKISVKMMNKVEKFLYPLQ